MPKRKPRRNGAASHRKPPVSVITLRIEPSLKQKLHAYCLKLSGQTGRRVSYNQGIIGLIEAAP